MDPGEQPICLQILTKVEEMLIEKVSPVLQVTYARGSQLKYSSHTIYFPQDISAIATQLPGYINTLDILIINKKNINNQYYSFHVNRNNIFEALTYKIKYDPYYRDVHIDEIALTLLHDTCIDISNILYTKSQYPTPVDIDVMEIDDSDEDIQQDNIHTISLYITNLPLGCREFDQSRTIVQLQDGLPPPSIE